MDLSQSQYLTGTSNVRIKISSLFGRAKIAVAEQLNTLGARVTRDTNTLLNGATADNEAASCRLGLEKLVNGRPFPCLDRNFQDRTLDEQVAYPAPAYTATDTPIAPQKGNSIEFGWKSGTLNDDLLSRNRDEIYYTQLF